MIKGEIDNMNDLATEPKNEMLEKILFPMFQLLDEKNIIEGITVSQEKKKLYICFDRDCLSDTNQLILERISYIYIETIFYSNDKYFPNDDRLEYWCPDTDYDKITHITERCHNKKFIVLELDLTDLFTSLGTTIMLANSLQEQDPMHLAFNEESLVLDSNIIERQKHYISAGYPDLRWINLCVSLNKENLLRDNPYSHSLCVSEINALVSCDDIFLTELVGYDKKTYINFCLDKEELASVINNYFEKQNSYIKEVHNITLDVIQKKLLK